MPRVPRPVSTKGERERRKEVKMPNVMMVKLLYLVCRAGWVLLALLVVAAGVGHLALMGAKGFGGPRAQSRAAPGFICQLLQPTAGWRVVPLVKGRLSVIC